MHDGPPLRLVLAGQEGFLPTQEGRYQRGADFDFQSLNWSQMAAVEVDLISGLGELSCGLRYQSDSKTLWYMSLLGRGCFMA